MSVENNNINILIVSNEKYLKYAIPLARSISNNCTNFNIHLHLINSHSTKVDKKLLKRVRNIKIYKVFREFASEEEEAGFCANYRFLVMPDLLKDYSNNVIYLDADSIVRCDLSSDSDINSYLNECDVALMTSKRIPPSTIIDVSTIDFKRQKRRVAFKTGVLVISNSEKIIRFFEDVRDGISTHGETKWYSDQLSFFDSVEKLGGELTLLQLTSSLFGLKLRQSDKIWVIKGDKYRNHQKYIDVINSLII